MAVALVHTVGREAREPLSNIVYPRTSFPCAGRQRACRLPRHALGVAGRAVLGHIEPASLGAVNSSISGSYARRRRAESGNRLPRPEPRKPRPDYNLHDRRQCLLGVDFVAKVVGGFPEE
jgi:hypothetical protein